MKITKKMKDQLSELNPHQVDNDALSNLLSNAKARAVSTNKTKKFSFKSQHKLVQEAFLQGKAGAELDLSICRHPNAHSFHTVTPDNELNSIVTQAVEVAQADYLKGLESKQKQWLEGEIAIYLKQQEDEQAEKVNQEKSKLFKELVLCLK